MIDTVESTNSNRWLGLQGGGSSRDGARTGNSMVSGVFGPDATVAVAVEAGHGFLGEEGEGLFEDCWVGGGWAVSIGKGKGTGKRVWCN